jgi:hypothetical protein
MLVQNVVAHFHSLFFVSVCPCTAINTHMSNIFCLETAVKQIRNKLTIQFVFLNCSFSPPLLTSQLLQNDDDVVLPGCKLVGRHQLFGETYCFHLHGCRRSDFSEMSAHGVTTQKNIVIFTVLRMSYLTYCQIRSRFSDVVRFL